MFNEKDQLAVDTLRALSIDTIEKANSGHQDYLWELPNGLHFVDTS